MKERQRNLFDFIRHQKQAFQQRLKDYQAENRIHWDDAFWHTGEKGVAWFHGSGKYSLNFSTVNRMKGLTSLSVDRIYADFMRAVIISEAFRKKATLSGASLEKRLNVLRRWYYEMWVMTGQHHPMYLSTDIMYAAMKRHAEHSSSPGNVSDYADIAVMLSRQLHTLNLTLTSPECRNKYPFRGTSTMTVMKRNIPDTAGEETDDDRLISIRAFMCIAEMTFLVRTPGEKIFLNFLILLIVTGFRFSEARTLKVNALLRREITDADKRKHATEQGLPA